MCSDVNVLTEFESRREKTRVSNQVRHKPGCTYTSLEDGVRLENSDLRRREIVLSM